MSAPAEGLTVLVVEDETLIRALIVHSLEHCGLKVVEAGNADEAIAVLEDRDDIHLVFTDVNMPGSMDGLKLAEYIRGRWPPIKLIVTSGQVSVKHTELPPGARFFSKPYDIPEVMKTMNEMTR
jgi:CheY-like chemotaxis protein